MEAKKIDIKNLKAVLDVALDHEDHLSRESIEYHKEDYPKGFLKKFDKLFDSLMDFEGDNDVIAYSECESFESYWKFIEYKGRIWAVRLMFGQGSAQDIWRLDICRRLSDCKWIGDKLALKAWRKCSSCVGKRVELQKEKVGPQVCHDDPNDIESYGVPVLEYPIAVYGMMTFRELQEMAELKMEETSYKRFWNFMVNGSKALSHDLLTKFCEEL